MALPWLIGAAVIGAGSYIAKKLREEEEEREREERRERRREQEAQERAEQARRAKALEEQKHAKIREFVAQGEEQTEDFKQHLNGLIAVEYTQNPAFCAKFSDASDAVNTMESGSYMRVRRVSNPFVVTHKLDLLDRRTRDSLTHFETLYQVELRPEPAISEAHEQLNYAEEALVGLSHLRQKLEHKRNKLSND